MIGLTTEAEYKILIEEVNRNEYDVVLIEEASTGGGGDGETPYIGLNGNWWIGGVDTGVKAAGTDGNDGVGISSITLHAINGLVKTYRITFTNTTTFDFDVTDGQDGNDGADAGFISLRTEAALFTLSETDANKYIRYTGATAITVVVPSSLVLLKPVTIEQAGAGQITFVNDAGLILNGDPKTGGQYKLIQLLKVADNVVNVIGGVE